MTRDEEFELRQRVAVLEHLVAGLFWRLGIEFDPSSLPLVAVAIEGTRAGEQEADLVNTMVDQGMVAEVHRMTGNPVPRREGG